MRTLAFVSLLALAPAAAFAVEISVGGTPISVPAPAGCAEVTDAMKPYSDLSKKFVPPANEQFALFLEEAQVALARSGAMPQSARRFYVQTTRDMMQPTIAASDFAELKKVVKTQNDEVMKKAEAAMPGIFEKLNKGITDTYKVDLNLTMTQMLPFPTHDESDASLSYSTFLKYNVTGADGKPSVFEGVVTTTFIYLRGKILFLYINAEKNDLEWSRTASKQWTGQIFAANPAIAGVAQTATASRLTALDWSKVGNNALIGGFVGGIIGLVIYLFRKSKG